MCSSVIALRNVIKNTFDQLQWWILSRDELLFTGWHYNVLIHLKYRDSQWPSSQNFVNHNVLWTSPRVKLKTNLMFYKVEQFKSSSCNAVFFMILIFEALAFKTLNWVYSIWNKFLFGKNHFHNVVSALTNVVKLNLKRTTLFRRCLTLSTSTLKHTTLIQRFSTL